MSSSLCQLWGKGALARDAVPAPVTTRWKYSKKELAPRKARVLKKRIRVCMIEEKRKEREELEKQRREAEAKGLTIQDLESKDNVHLKIVQHEERLDELQKEKHKLFLTLKKVLLNEKKQQIAAQPAPPKRPQEPRTPSMQMQSPSMRPRMSQEDWNGAPGGFGRPTMSNAPRMYVPNAGFGGQQQGAGMRQTPSMLQQFGGYAAAPARPSMMHSGPRDYGGGAFPRGGRGGGGSMGRGRGRGQFASAGPAWRYQEAKRGGRGGPGHRKDGYYGAPGRP
mmetsp:Transcript_14215/g.55981  ORF Transcript_14215/g.55981 Transcript_14215/m.55981 type:complete len:279 (+) Transcript_14215:77-913(+)|eukprot:CAMPEP_0114612286 /NCGR_PEP_ID=MMETSP0168-20121206/4545_1 /TAXON_ID=95228 ORGANISM="Vannella sp., Strain DIVA3 517/6/12" /NCGR_SAMPLE_ID=MMETSP0168 /ASSEMBLY_ACC=CAM_ASM_000044 /LENGTH=278 /DNA_ID=CAMNT_0001823269 /DNA_START=55 /DNA_END=891 /DNA_ORIENTATION=+